MKHYGGAARKAQAHCLGTVHVFRHSGSVMITGSCFWACTWKYLKKKKKKKKRKKKKKERNQVTSSEPFHSHLSMAVYVDMFASASDVWKLEEVALSPV